MRISASEIRSAKLRNENPVHAKRVELRREKMRGSCCKMWTASNPSLPSQAQAAKDDKKRKEVILENQINNLKTPEVKSW